MIYCLRDQTAIYHIQALFQKDYWEIIVSKTGSENPFVIQWVDNEWKMHQSDKWRWRKLLKLIYKSALVFRLGLVQFWHIFDVWFRILFFVESRKDCDENFQNMMIPWIKKQDFLSSQPLSKATKVFFFCSTSGRIGFHPCVKVQKNAIGGKSPCHDLYKLNIS